MKTIVIIQARLGSTRFPNKVMETVGGIPILKRVWENAYYASHILSDWKGNTYKPVVAWPERYPDLDENNVLERFRRIAKEYDADVIIRLTADCPLLNYWDIVDAVKHFHGEYYSNHIDGHDVQIFTRKVLDGNEITHKEHVIADFTTPSTGLSVNTKEDLERVRRIVNEK